MPTTIGTSFFVSRAAAVRYYAHQYADYPSSARAMVDQKLQAGDIHIGAPAVLDDETLSVVDNGTRYAITEADPVVIGVGTDPNTARPLYIADLPGSDGIRAFAERRPEELRREMNGLRHSALADRMFGHNARTCLDVIEEEVG